MSNSKEELEFEISQGWRWARKFVLYPLLAVFIIAAGIAAAMMIWQYTTMPQAPEALRQEESQATTDLYADSIIMALNCMKTDESGGCNIDDNRSTLIQNVTEGVITLNGKDYSAGNKDAILKTVDDTILNDISYNSLNTENRGTMDEEISYSSKDHTLKFNFTENSNGELVLTTLEAEENK